MRAGVTWAVAWLIILILPALVLATTAQTYQAKVIGVCQ